MSVLSELRKQKKLFKSNCCQDTFKSKSNGLWTYYFCDKCNNKTTPVHGNRELDMYGKIQHIPQRKKQSK